MTIKTWFLNKNFTSNERMAIETADLSVENETEKALFIKAESDYGTLKFWCPKSCVEKSEKKFLSKDEIEEIKKTAKTVTINGRKFLIV